MSGSHLRATDALGEDELLQAAVMHTVLNVASREITLSELRSVFDGRGETPQALQGAVLILEGCGLLQLDGETVRPTAAAIKLDRLFWE